MPVAPDFSDDATPTVSNTNDVKSETGNDVKSGDSSGNHNCNRITIHDIDPNDATANTRKERIAKQAAIHNASLAAGKTRTNTALAAQHTTPSAFARATKASMELEMAALTARLALLEDLATMTDEQKMESLFAVLDKNRDGALSVVELADGMRKIKGDPTVGFEESLGVAMDRVAHFDKTGDAKLQFHEFKDYANTLAKALGATFHDLAELLILSVVFSDNGNNDLENLTASICEDTITQALLEEEALAKVMEDDRMRALFHLFDLDADGSVDFSEVVAGLYKISKDLQDSGGKASVAMLLYDDEHNNLLDYTEFTRFVVKLIASTGQTFDEAIFRMTVSAAVDDPDQMTKDTLLEKLKTMIEEDEEVEKKEAKEKEEVKEEETAGK